MEGIIEKPLIVNWTRFDYPKYHSSDWPVSGKHCQVSAMLYLLELLKSLGQKVLSKKFVKL